MLQPVLNSLIAGLPIFLLHLGVALAVFLLALSAYLWLTPHKEMALIREGNTAAAISLGGAALGFAIPMAFCMSASVNTWDIVIWGAVALVVQIVAFRAVDLVLHQLPKRIEHDEISAAVFLAAMKIAVAMLNAAAVSG
jgi:putative membrane protein